MKKIVISAIVCTLLIVTLLSVTACSKPVEKEFIFDGNSVIILTSEFKEQKDDKFAVTLKSKKAIFKALKENFDGFKNMGIDPLNYTLNEYAELIKTKNNLTEAVIEEDPETNRLTITCERGGTFLYGVFFKTTDSFWCCQFICNSADKEEYQTKFREWSKTIIV